MDRRGALNAGVVRCLRGALPALLLAASCGGDAGERPLAPGEAPPGPARGWRDEATLARGVLAYQVELGADAIASVELGVRFELVVRAPDGAVRGRHDLGPPDYDVTDLSLTEDGRAAWVSSLDGRVRRVELASGRIASGWQLGAAATAVEAAGEHVLTGSAAGVLCLRRARDAALLQCVVASEAPIAAIAARGAIAATASWSGEVIVWELPSLRRIAAHREPGSANDVAVSPDGRTLAVARSRSPPVRTPLVARREAEVGYRAADRDAVVRFLALEDEARLVPRGAGEGHRAPVTSVAWTGDGARVVSGSWDRSARLWDAATGRELARATGFSHLVHDVAASADSRLIGIASWATEVDAPAVTLRALLYAGHLPPRPH